MASPKSEECSADVSSKNKTSLSSNTKAFSTVQAQECRPSYSVAQHPLWEWDGYNVIVPVRKQNTCFGISHHVASHLYPSLAGGNSRLIMPSSCNGFHSNVLVSPFETSSIHDRTSHGYRSYQRLESLGSRLSGLGNRTTATSSYVNGFIHSIPSRAISCDSLMKSNSAISPISQHYNSHSAGCEPVSMGKNNPNHASKSTSLHRKPLLNTNAFMRPTSAKVPLHQKWEKSPKTATSNGTNEFGDTENPVKYNGGSTKVISGSPVHSNTEGKIDRPFYQNEHSYGNLKSAIKLTKNIPGDPEIKFTEAVKRLSEDRIPKNNVHERCVTFSKETEDLSSQGIHIQNVTYNSAGGIFKRTVPNLIKESNLQSALKSEYVYSNGNLEPLVKENSTSKENAITSTNKTPAGVLSTSVHIRNNSPVSFPGATGLHQGPDQIKKRISFCAPKANISSLTLQIAAMQLRPANKVVKDPENSKNEVDSQGSDVDIEGEEFADGLEDASSQDYDEESECSTITDSCSTMSMDGSTKMNFNVAVPESPDIKNAFDVGYPQAHECKLQVAKPALIKSLFHDMPLMIYFGTPNEKIEQLPWEQRRQMKWKMSTVTPIVVKNAVARSHFKITKKSYDWLGCWGHHMKSPLFKTLREYQKLNHFPGSFQIGRKDRLWRNLLKMQPASARGIGIQVIHKWNQIPKKRPLLVQKYLHKPYLIGESKFDLRIYVYVTSYDPLRIYMFTDGLVRFASCKYSSSMKSLSNKFMHLTNYSVNKLNAEYKPNSDEKLCQGHKWSLKALWLYLNQKGVKTEQLREQMKDVIIKTIIASESYVNSQINLYVRNRYTCHELFGFDIMLDENLKMWVLEVNISPSLHSSSALDINIKGQMVSDLLNLAGFIIPQKEDVTPDITKSTSATRPKSNELSPDEKLKRVYYLSQKSPPKDSYSSLLDILTPEDIRMLMESEDEYNRRGQFERIFPCLFSSRYLRFFEQPRYFNILLDLWEQKYGQNRQAGIEMLQELSYRRVHSGLSVNPAHVWHPPKSNLTPKLDVGQNGVHKPNPSSESQDSPQIKTVKQEPSLPPQKSLDAQQSS
ncbi:tubulin polyglutamylase TTLL4 isoform X2 [Pristis pectinata]|uniref:tubulin polyglutamylase TTLL4 isoform X2 n=1 Tax=Pristis pectinata TaxID=685728 RepID=UPI00223D2416|nr:tubulin polyglutamylase TTLL4 isoform X2 [Pristis pectinata]